LGSLKRLRKNWTVKVSPGVLMSTPLMMVTFLPFFTAALKGAARKVRVVCVARGVDEEWVSCVGRARRLQTKQKSAHIIATRPKAARALALPAHIILLTTLLTISLLSLPLEGEGGVALRPLGSYGNRIEDQVTSVSPK
jgi:hypothetical protein